MSTQSEWSILDAKDMLMRQLFIHGAKSEDVLQSIARYYGISDDVYFAAMQELLSEKRVSSYPVKYYVTSSQLDSYLKEQEKNL